MGVDVAQYIDVATAQCFNASAGVDFAIVRAWHSFGAFDTNAPVTMANFWDAGYAHVDAYLFPCPSQDAAAQVAGVIANLTAAGSRYGMLWFDIEPNPSTGCAWSSDTAANCAYLQRLVDAGAASGANWGVYTYWDGWYGLMGDSCTAGGTLPLWWASYDGEQNFSNWQPLGPWNQPAMKQYSGSSTVCDVYLDMDWYPSR